MSNLYNDPVTVYNSLVVQIAAKEVRGRKQQALVEYCPFCGADNEKHLRASFGQVFPGNNWGYHCFACSRSCSLFHLANLLNVTPNDDPIERQIKPLAPPEYPSWYSGRQSLQSAYASIPERYQAWERYKGVSQAMVDRYALGYGVLPGDKGFSHSCSHWRLITPILDVTGEVVWFRGRSIHCECAKWHSASLRDYHMASIGAALPQSHYAKRGADYLFITENYVDAGMINMSSRYSAVATLSTSYWLPLWTEQLAALSPSLVIVAYDADLSGNGGSKKEVTDRAVKIVSKRLELPPERIEVISVTVMPDHYAVDWKTQAHQGVQFVASPRGVTLANHLLEYGFAVKLLKWSSSGLDMGKYLAG